MVGQYGVYAMHSRKIMKRYNYNYRHDLYFKFHIVPLAHRPQYYVLGGACCNYGSQISHLASCIAFYATDNPLYVSDMVHCASDIEMP